jgi:hypothetical protein
MPNIAEFVAGFKSYVVTPLNAFGIGGFVFDIEGDTAVNLTAEITDHYTENNKTFQDQIAIRPKKITLKNYVGELTYNTDENTGTIPQQVVQKLTTLSSFLPQLASATQQGYDFLTQNKSFSQAVKDINFSDALGTATDLWAFAKNLSNFTSKQQQAYMFFKAMFEQQLLTSVQTPFEFMPNMAIESIQAIQAENSRDISDFTITLKQIRVAQTINIAYGNLSLRDQVAQDVLEQDAANYQGRSLQQAQSLVNGGQMPGLPTPAAELGPSAVTASDIAAEWLKTDGIFINEPAPPIQ